MTNHFTQEEAEKLVTKMGFPIGSFEGSEFFEIASEGILALCNAAVDAKLAKAEAIWQARDKGFGSWGEIDPEHADGMRKLGHEVRVLYTHPQASEPAPSTAGEQGERAEVAALLKTTSGCTAHDQEVIYRAAALLEAQPKLEPLTDPSDFATIAGLESATGHLSVLVDELRSLLGRAMQNFRTLHSAAKPDDGPDMDAIIPARVFSQFVDEDAAIRYALNQTSHHDMIPAMRSERAGITEDQVDAALRAARLINTTESRKDMRRAIEAAHKIGGQG